MYLIHQFAEYFKYEILIEYYIEQLHLYYIKINKIFFQTQFFLLNRFSVLVHTNRESKQKYPHQDTHIN